LKSLILNDSSNIVVRNLKTVDSIQVSGKLSSFSITVEVHGNAVSSMQFKINGGAPIVDSSEPFKLSSSSILSSYVTTTSVFSIEFQPTGSNGIKLGSSTTLTLILVFPSSPSTISLSTYGLLLPNVEPNDSTVSGFQVVNSGSSSATLVSFEIAQNSNFDFRIDNTLIRSSQSSAIVSTSITVSAGSVLPVFVSFSATQPGVYSACGTLKFSGIPNIAFCMAGVCEDWQGEHTLHPVVRIPAEIVDYNGNSLESILADATESHTHEEGRDLVSYNWFLDFVPLSAKTAQTTMSVSTGPHVVNMEIVDNVGKTLTAGIEFEVYPPTTVGGAVIRYYSGSLSTYNAITANPRTSITSTLQFMELSKDFRVTQDSSLRYGGSSFTGNVMILISSTLNLVQSGSFALSPLSTGGVQCKFFVNGVVRIAGFLAPSSSEVDLLCFAGNGLSSASMSLLLDASLLSSAGALFSSYRLVRNHQQLAQSPFLNIISPSTGSNQGGFSTFISGVGFAPPIQVMWGSTPLPSSSIVSSSFTQIQILVPAQGSTSSPVSVTVKSGTQTSSNSVSFQYSTTVVPVKFTSKSFDLNMFKGTVIHWDTETESVYLGNQAMEVTVFKFSDDFSTLQSQTVLNGCKGAYSSMPTILGLEISPFDRHLYIAHSKIFFAKGQDPFPNPYPYLAQLSRLRAPSYTKCEPVVVRLPVSNHDHAVNGIQFMDDGTLLLGVGGQTNGGIPHIALGLLDESPLTAAVLAIQVYKAGFNGNLDYFTIGSNPPQLNNDQRFGHNVYLGSAYTPFVSIWASGLRNPFDLVYTSTGRIYVTDNGPNKGYGAFSTGPTTSMADFTESDKVCDATAPNQYFGCAHRNRGRTDSRQNFWRGHASTQNDFSKCLDLKFSASAGIIEYRANSFNGALKNDLIVLKWKADVHVVPISVTDGKTIFSYNSATSAIASLATIDPLDLDNLPGGAIIFSYYLSSSVPVKLTVATPDDDFIKSLPAGTPYLIDVSPFRCDAARTCKMIIGGVNLNGASSVSIAGGVTVTITRKTNIRIVGTVPIPPSALADGTLRTVSVSFSNGQTLTLPSSFKWVKLPAGSVLP